MLERDASWHEFLYCLEQDKPRDLVAAHFGLHRHTVNQYIDMLRGREVLEPHGQIPWNLMPFAIGFKYRAVIRWIDTPEITRARLEYDLGRIELATGRAIVREDPAWILYAFPRKVSVNRELYFSAPVFAS